jgi:hypothetical protein
LGRLKNERKEREREVSEKFARPTTKKKHTAIEVDVVEARESHGRGNA